MTSVVRLEGRRISSEIIPLVSVECTRRIQDAVRGSRMLKEAILRAKGYKVPVAIVPPPPVEEPKLTAPRFRKRAVVRKGRHKRRGRKPSAHSPRVEQIKALVAAHFAMSLEDLGRGNKHYERSHPRQIAMYLSRKATATSLPGIGRQFGGFDHTTVLYAVRQVEKRIENNDQETLKAIHAVHSVIGA